MAQTQGGRFMKQFRQLAALFLAFAMVIGVFSTPTVASAEGTLTSTTLGTGGEVTIDYVNEKLEIKKESGDIIYYSFKYAEKSHTKTVWETAYNESDTKATVDFSNTGATKAVKVYLTDDKEKKPYEVEIKAQETTLAVAFSGVANTTTKSRIKVVNDWTALTAKMAGYSTATVNNPWSYGYLCITVGKGTAAKAITADEAKYIQFRKGTTGQWKSLEDLDVRKFTAYGAQLYFRIKADNDGAVVTGAAITVLGRPSKEVKVTYTKQANAPKISINGATKEVKLTKTQEYRVYTTSEGLKVPGSWIKVADNHMDGTKVKKVYLKDLFTATGSPWTYNEELEGQGIELRVAASDKGSASKVAKVALNKAITPDVSTDGAITFTLVDKTTFAKGITVKNVSGPAIQVAVVTGDAFDVNNTKVVKWASVAPGKSKILSGKVLATGDKIIVRNATIKDNTKTPTNEFVVASDYATIDKATRFVLADKSFAVTNPVINPTVPNTNVTAIGSGLNYTVTVTNTASPAAITVVADVTTANVAIGTPSDKCVTAVGSDTTAPEAGISASANKFTITGGKITFKITDEAEFGTRYFKFTIDGVVAYVTLVYKNS
jgi:hypothetical protein